MLRVENVMTIWCWKCNDNLMLKMYPVKWSQFRPGWIQINQCKLCSYLILLTVNVMKWVRTSSDTIWC